MRKSFYGALTPPRNTYPLNHHTRELGLPIYVHGTSAQTAVVKIFHLKSDETVQIWQ